MGAVPQLTGAVPGLMGAVPQLTGAVPGLMGAVYLATLVTNTQFVSTHYLTLMTSNQIRLLHSDSHIHEVQNIDATFCHIFCNWIRLMLDNGKALR
jgi:hypothetical protein